MKSITVFLKLLIVLLIVASIGGTYATWRYAEEKAENNNDLMNIKINEFTWAPEEILPTDKPGENYIELLKSILENNKAGLNSNKDTLENAVLKDVIVHSSQNVQGGNLKHLFISSASRELDFVVEYIEDDQFAVYMFDNKDVNNGLVDVTFIKVYKTILIQENGVWTGKESQLGYAVLRYFKNTNYIAITPSEWVLGNIPTNNNL